jgi:DNA-binding transcriptional LysR family regulator
VSCPHNLADRWLGPMLPPFLEAHPRVRLLLDITSRRVDVIGEGIDVALRVQRPPLEDSGLVLRRLGELRRILVASPGLIAGSVGAPQNLARYPVVGSAQGGKDLVWALSGPDGAHGSSCVGCPCWRRTIWSSKSRPPSPASAWRCCRRCFAATRSPMAAWCSCCPNGRTRSA